MNTPRFVPPTWAMSFFRFICKPEFLEEIEGDLAEIYEIKAETESINKLRWLFILEVILLIRPKLLKSVIPSSSNSFFLLDHLKVSVRNLKKYHTQTISNIIGLSIGLSVTILFFLVFRYELSFDRFHKGYDQIYRLTEQDENGASYYQTRIPLAPQAKESIPGVEKATRLISWADMWLETKHGRTQANLTCTDPDFADIFDFEIIEGNPKSALENRFNLIITDKVAHELFGDQRAVGREIRAIQGDQIWTVGAVLKEPAANSTVRFEMLAGWGSLPDNLQSQQSSNWRSLLVRVYLKLEKFSTPEDVSSQMADLVKQNFEPISDASSRKIVLQPLKDQRAVLTNNTKPLRLLAVTALIILGMAGLNFVNMTTAQCFVRAKEIAIRKIIGSSRQQLVFQLQVESILLNLAAGVVALIVSYSLLPFLEDKFTISLDLDWKDWIQLSSVVLSTLLVFGLLLGVFPAFYITSSSVVTGIKGIVSRSNYRGRLHDVLLIIQFGASIFLVASTIGVWRQVNFMKNQSLHFDSNKILVVPVPGQNFTNAADARRLLKLSAASYNKDSGIEAVSFGQNIPGKYAPSYKDLSDRLAPDSKFQIRTAIVSSRYFETLGIEFLKGRSYKSDWPSDSNAVVINRRAMQEFGWQTIEEKVLCDERKDGCKLYKVVGVVEDYHYQSMQNAIEPVVHFFYDDFFSYMIVRFKADRTKEVLSTLEADWKNLNPLSGFSYFFLEDEFDQMYAEQERLGILAGLFSFASIIIAGFGLLSVVTFLVKRRRKEIGVRKITGASVLQLAILLARKYALLVAIAFGASAPIAYVAISNFLEDFAYRTPIDATPFLLTGVIIFLSVVTSLSLIVIRASRTNPIEVLREQ